MRIYAKVMNSAGYCGRLKHGTGYACTGNHEYYAGVDEFLKMAEESNIRVLLNEHVVIADTIVLAGVNDSSEKRMSGPGDDLEKALAGADLNKPVVLLSHQPDVFKQAHKAGVNLQLSGHTHAGQIPPMDLIVQLYFKYTYGLYREGTSYIYTTCGTGTWGPPMRLFSRSEIVKIVLEKK